MDLSGRVGAVRSRQDLADFVQALKADLESNPAEWTNGQLAAFLDAVAAWVEDMDGYYENAGQPLPDPPSWRTFGEILLAAKLYE